MIRSKDTYRGNRRRIIKLVREGQLLIKWISNEKHMVGEYPAEYTLPTQEELTDYTLESERLYQNSTHVSH